MSPTSAPFAIACFCAAVFLTSAPFNPLLAQNKTPPPAQLKALQNLADSTESPAMMALEELIQVCTERDGTVSFRPRIAACSAALRSPGLSDADRALVLYKRGELHRTMLDEFRARADFAEALGLYDRLVAAGTPAPGLLQQRGSSAHALGFRDRALSDYDLVIQLDPRNARVLINRGILLAKHKHDYAAAIADLDQALALEPDDEDALMARGEAYGDFGDVPRALADLDRAIALEPLNSKAYLLRGIVSGRSGDQESAYVDYDKAATLDPLNAEALVNRAAIRSTRGDQDGAIVDLDAAIALQPDDPAARYNRGYAYFAKRDYGRAIDDYSAAIRANPKMSMAYNNRCLARVIAGRELAEAIADCDLALSQMPDSPQYRDTRGFVHLKLGKPDLALVDYEAALRIAPQWPRALYGRGLASIKLGRTAEGEADRVAARLLLPGIDSHFSIYGLD
ncbi:MAG: tetratricopeptide repeat protein [Alphaproteobacteria bacterium]|nr:tetratricopeptide repeat protein [Alphaproteobacteria bacterium]